MKVMITTLWDKPALSPELPGCLERMAGQLLAEHGLEKGELGIILADNARLQELNRTYRRLDAPTDVLSFSMLEEGGGPAEPTGEEEPLLGDIYISLEQAALQAEEAGHSLEREVLILAIHGLLHILGFDHEDEESAREMEAEEARVINIFGKDC